MPIFTGCVYFYDTGGGTSGDGYTVVGRATPDGYADEEHQHHEQCDGSDANSSGA